MFQKNKASWIPGTIWKPKNPHSLDHLKFLYNVLCKNQAVTEQNKALLIETMRSISEILIWGDQNDSSVFDFFLEKNMLSFFLRFMRQKSGRHLCVQLLQTLNILFDNISNETSVYYLLSNNHINSIIVHKFDFSDEEVMAYYISFLKTLSLKLNKHTIHFFYNEHTNDFALYTEAIKFFNHSESMVRIAVRTITLNVYRVDDRSMLRYIRDKTAAPYFSNLVWFIGNHVLDLDICVRHDIDHNSKGRLADLVAEHLDHLHYVNDILNLNIDALNDVLTDHLLNRLLIPLYVYSLTKRKKYAPRSDEKPHVSSVVSLFLLSQVFLILSHAPLVRQLADLIFNGDASVCGPDAEPSASPLSVLRGLRGFRKPVEPLAQTLENNRGGGRPIKRPNYKNSDEPSGQSPSGNIYYDEQQKTVEEDPVVLSTESELPAAAAAAAPDGQAAVEGGVQSSTDQPTLAALATAASQNSTDEEKLLISGGSTPDQRQLDFTVTDRPYLEAVFNALECSENDYEALFALCLLYALGHNTGINQELLDTVLMPTDKSENKSYYNILLVEKLIRVISLSCQTGSKVRLATLEMSILLLKTLVYRDGCCFLQDRHLAAIEGAREEATLMLRNFYKVWEKSEEIFLDMFEDEYREMKECPLNVEYLTMDASILLPPTGTPLSGIDFKKRLPCGEVERARRAIRVFFHLHDLSLTLRQEVETQLPLTKEEECVQLRDVLDLNNSDLIACTVISQNNRRERRFLVIDVLQLILVEPDMRKLGWGVVKFVGFLQDVEVTGDKDDSRSLHITIHKPSMNVHARPLPLLSARFIFDDHIRCMAAKQRLTKGRLKARQRKMQMIARLLELPSHIVESMYQPPVHAQSAVTLKAGRSHQQAAIPGRSHRQAHRGQHSDTGHRSSTQQAKDLNKPRTRQSMPARPSSRPVAINQQPGGVVRVGQAQRQPPKQTQAHQGSPPVEQAEEATPSPETHALHSLNQSQTSSKTEQALPPEGAHPKQDIPLEDLSRKAKAVFSNATGLFSKRGIGSEGMRGRSSSYSPSRRGRRSGSGSPRLRSGSPATSGSPRRLGSQGETRDRAGSEGDAPAGQAVTSFTAPPKHPEQSKPSQRGSKDITAATMSPPKSLTPAQEPRVSLVLSCDSTPGLAAQGLGSPKLLPPADTDQVKLRSDASSTLSEADSASSYASSTVSDTERLPPPRSNTRQPVLAETPASAGVSRVERAVPGDGSATNQLTRLAQIVQEHYSGVAEEPNNLEMRDIDVEVFPNVTDDTKKQS